MPWYCRANGRYVAAHNKTLAGGQTQGPGNVLIFHKQCCASVSAWWNGTNRPLHLVKQPRRLLSGDQATLRRVFSSPDSQLLNRLPL